MKFKTLNFLILIVTGLLFWLAFNKLSFTLKLKDNPGRVTSTGDLLNPNGVNSMVITPLRDGINTMIFTSKRPYYLRGENEGKLHLEMTCFAENGSVYNQFLTEIPVNKLNAKASQEVKINPPLNCKDRETTVKFTATVPGAVSSPEEYLSISVGDNSLLLYRHQVFLRDIIKEMNQSLARDDKFIILYYYFIGFCLLLIIIFSLLEVDKRGR